MDDFRYAVSDWWTEYWTLVLLLIGMLVGLIVLVVAGTYFIDRPSCYARFGDLNMQVRWSFYGGCQVEVDGLWTPVEAYRVAEVRR